MIDYLKEYWMFVMALAAGAGAWYKGKSDILSHGARIDALEKQSIRTQYNSDNIAKLQTEIAVQHRMIENLNNHIRDVDARMQANITNMDKKLDRIETYIHSINK